MATIEKLLTTIKKINPSVDTDMVHFAYEFAAIAHKDQKRVSGEPYIIHPLATAQTLAELKLDTTIIIAGLLHDIHEDTPVTLEEITKNFGEDVASMVAGVTKLGHIKYRGVERYIENLRKMFVAMANDVRVIIIKFADRLHNLKTLDSLAETKQYRIALESLEIFAPIANRLGMGDMKGQLEDLSFKYIKPEDYTRVSEIARKRYEESKHLLEKMRKQTEAEILKAGIKVVSFHGRIKFLYSLYKKLLRHNNDINKIYDLVAMRVIVEDVGDCYAALGVIHKLWRPLKGRIKDYMSQPKPNGYQSLHTTVFGLEGQITEFQIRTLKMHEEAEFGIAAHWNYDEKGSTIPDKKLTWVKELASLQREMMQEVKDLEGLKLDVFQNRIFVFTPKGDVIDLPEDSTPIDFAYAIHTEIGNKCVGARINDQLFKLDTRLKSGDVLEIIIDKNRKGPSIDWLKFVKTSQARNRIKAYAKQSLTGWFKIKILPEKTLKKES